MDLKLNLHDRRPDCNDRRDRNDRNGRDDCNGRDDRNGRDDCNDRNDCNDQRPGCNDHRPGCNDQRPGCNDRSHCHELHESCESAGQLPRIAPLATAYVPMQCADAPRYCPAEGLRHGTLFKGLDLPFKNKGSRGTFPSTIAYELMAVRFAAHELRLYCDTHPCDKCACELQGKYDTKLERLRLEYECEFGPLTEYSEHCCEHDRWVNGCWPWEYREGRN